MNGTKATTRSFNEPLKLWDLTAGLQLAEFDGADSAGFHPTLPHLVVATPPNTITIHTLDSSELIAIAESRLTRDLTEAECITYLGEAACPPT